MSALVSSLIPVVLAKLGPLDPDRLADLRPYLESVPDLRSRRGRWYPLVSILLVCACAAASGAKTIDEIAEWGARAATGLLELLGVRRHLLRWRHAPSRAAIGRVLARLNGDALDATVGAYLADRHRAEMTTDPTPCRGGSGGSSRRWQVADRLGPPWPEAAAPALGGHARAPGDHRPG